MLLLHGDSLGLSEHVPAASAQLVYLDPPFAVGTQFLARTKPRQVRAHAGESAGAGNPPLNTNVAYDDRWPSLDAYLAWLERRIRMVRGLLSAEGTMWLHLDHRAVHEAKGLCDAVFGRARFLGEIIWVPGNGGKARRGPSVTHQTILVYAAGETFRWNGDDPMLREPYAATSLAMHFRQSDEDGRRYRERTIGGKTYRYYADVGRALGSVWTDCPAMVANTPLRKETTGYPTQKPLKLLERIVRASTAPGDLVIDPFCGSGTTLVAAAQLGRRFVGADIGELAIETTSQRLRELNASFEVRPSAKVDATREEPLEAR
jgi:site-specific DNA-methyltransferase (adenine-specific)